MRYEDNLNKKYCIELIAVCLEGVTVEPSGKEFRSFRGQKLKELRDRYSLETIKDHPIVRAYRDFYWRIGIDPTKVRPSSEALIRRVLQGKEIPEINNAVDCYNLASMLTLISIGAYDRAKLEGELTLRYSSGEEFAGIGGKKLVTSRHIVVSDGEKIINIFPYRDSDATKVTPETKEVHLLLSKVEGIEESYVEWAAGYTRELVARFCVV